MWLSDSLLVEIVKGTLELISTLVMGHMMSMRAVRGSGSGKAVPGTGIEHTAITSSQLDKLPPVPRTGGISTRPAGGIQQIIDRRPAQNS